MLMLWSAVIGGAASLIGGAMSSRSARNSQNAQMAMHQEQMDLARDQMGFAQGHYDYGRNQYEQQQARFDPILDQMQSQALANQQPDYGLITADAAQAFGSQRQAGQRQMERYGINPGDGMWGANNRQAQLGQAGAEVMAMQNARRNAGNQRYNQLANLYGVGTRLMGQAAGMMGQGVGATAGAAGMGINAAGQAAQTHGNYAAQAGQQAGNNWSSAFSHIGNVVDGVMNQSNSTPNSQVPYYLSNQPSSAQPGAPQQPYMDTPWTGGGG